MRYQIYMNRSVVNINRSVVNMNRSVVYMNGIHAQISQILRTF